MEKQKNVPALRFPEFTTEWKFAEIGKIYNEIVVGFVGTVSDSYCSREIGIPFIRTLNVKDGYFSLDNIEYVTPQFHNSNNKSKIYNEDILIARVGANMGQVCKVSGLNTEANSANVLILKKSSENSSDFYTQYLVSGYGQKQIHSRGAGGAQEVLNVSVTKTILVPTIKLDEQTKIANFLSAIDTKIQQLTQKKALLEEYKKGVMQQLFSQKIRFKDENGEDYPDWEEKKLGEVGENIIGLTYSPKNVVKGGGVLVLRSSNIKNDSLDLEDQVRVSAKIPEKLFIKVGDILLCTRNGSQRLIGKNVLIRSIQEPTTFGAFMSVFRSTQNDFIAQLFKTDWFSEQIQMNLGARINQITTGVLNKFTFNFPSLPEQTKIANFLTAIDTKIETVTKQIDQTQAYKKGLLQQLFI